MDISIIGAGRLGASLAKRFAALGHAVDVRVANPDDGKHRDLAQTANVTIAAIKDPLTAHMIFLAVPWNAAKTIVAELGDLEGRILVDCTNPVAFGADGLSLVIGHETSAAEVIAENAINGTVFKALNQLGTPIIDDPSRFPSAPLMYVAGPDGRHKDTVMALVSALGFDAHDAGQLDAARLLEPLALLWMRQAFGSENLPNFTHVRQQA